MLQEYTKQMTRELCKLIYQTNLKNIIFLKNWEISKQLIKKKNWINDFNLFATNYLVEFYFQENYLHLFYQKNLLQNLKLAIKKMSFTCFY